MRSCGSGREKRLRRHTPIGATMIFVTHDQVEAMTLGDRIVIMRDGFIQQAGSPLDLYDRPANAFVATFIGSPEMNLIDGGWMCDGGALVMRSGGLSVNLPAQSFSEAERDVTLGIRPEHIERAETSTAFELVVGLSSKSARKPMCWVRSMATKSARYLLGTMR